MRVLARFSRTAMTILKDIEVVASWVQHPFSFLSRLSCSTIVNFGHQIWRVHNNRSSRSNMGLIWVPIPERRRVITKLVLLFLCFPHFFIVSRVDAYLWLEKTPISQPLTIEAHEGFTSTSNLANCHGHRPLMVRPIRICVIAGGNEATLSNAKGPTGFFSHVILLSLINSSTCFLVILLFTHRIVAVFCWKLWRW